MAKPSVWTNLRGVDEREAFLNAAFFNVAFDLAVDRNDASPLRDVHPKFFGEGFHRRSLNVVFRSAKERVFGWLREIRDYFEINGYKTRPFAERKATLVRMHPRAARGGHGTSSAAAARTGATRTAFRFRCAATGAAAGGEQVDKLVKLHACGIGLGESRGKGVDLGSRLAEEIEQQRLAVEEEFDFGQGCGNVVFGEERFAIDKSLLSVLFQPGQQQIVLDRHAAENRPGRRTDIAVFRGIVERRKDFPHFQPTFGAADDARAAGIAVPIARAEPRDLPHHAISNPVLA
jgi:hypothetical protein